MGEFDNTDPSTIMDTIRRRAAEVKTVDLDPERPATHAELESVLARLHWLEDVIMDGPCYCDQSTFSDQTVFTTLPHDVCARCALLGERHGDNG